MPPSALERIKINIASLIYQNRGKIIFGIRQESIRFDSEDWYLGDNGW